MAEENESQEKTEEPSQRKLEQAKEDGKVLTSKEMYVFTSLAMAFFFMTIISLFLKPYIMEWSKLFQFDKYTLDHFSSIRQIQLSKLNDSYFFILKITLMVFDNLLNSPLRSDSLFKAKIISELGLSFLYLFIKSARGLS